MGVRHRRWLRHASTLPVAVAGAWHGIEAGSRGAILAAGVGAVSWLVWPEAARLLAWRRQRRAERARLRHARAMERAEKRVRKAEDARRRADRRPKSARLARRATRLEVRAKRAVARAGETRKRAASLSEGDDRRPAEDVVRRAKNG